jgi:glycosyltransferase involved in cell wall biosynthesis
VRILLVSHTLPHDEPGGSQDYVVALGSALRADHDVVVLSGSHADSTGLTVRTVPRLPALQSSASIAHKAVWHLRDQWSPKQHRLLRRELSAFRPDVVHTHQCQGLTGAVFSAIAASRLPHVHTAHDLNLLCLRITMTRGGQPCGGRCLACLGQRAIKGSLIARRLNYLISPSDFGRDAHVDAGIVDASRAITVRHGAIPGTSRLRGLQPGPLSVGFIGAMASHKGISTLLAAVQSSQRLWQLHIAGDGPLVPQVINAASRNPRISYHGFLRDGARDSFYDALDLLVVPSEYAEAATLVVTEAAVRALPYIVSDRGGLPETPLAIVVKSGNPGELARAIDCLDGTREWLCRASAMLATRQQEFVWARHLARVIEILERAGREPSRPDPRLLRASGMFHRPVPHR